MSPDIAPLLQASWLFRFHLRTSTSSSKSLTLKMKHCACPASVWLWNNRSLRSSSQNAAWAHLCSRGSEQRPDIVYVGRKKMLESFILEHKEYLWRGIQHNSVIPASLCAAMLISPNVFLRLLCHCVLTYPSPGWSQWPDFSPHPYSCSSLFPPHFQPRSHISVFLPQIWKRELLVNDTKASMVLWIMRNSDWNVKVPGPSLLP